MKNNTIEWDQALITRYDLSGPRYTSYPTAIQFNQGQQTSPLIETALATSNPNSPLSIYTHIPFCSHVCFFCACNKVITAKKDRAKPYLHLVQQEAKTLSRLYGNNRPVNQLHLGGGTPTFLNDDQIAQYISTLQQLFNLQTSSGRDYSIEIDPREANGKRIENLAKLGFNRISLGIQDTSTKVQKAVNRVQPLSLTEELVHSARESGIKSINFDLIYGLPHQDATTFQATIDEVIALSPDRLSIFNYAHMPDRFRPQRRINASDLPSPDEKLKILANTIQQLTKAGYIYIGMDHFAKPEDELAIAQQKGELHRNFQGYTTHKECDLIALGVSAISQVGNTYYQNHHELSSYEQLITSQGHALHKGVTLSKDDLIRRHVINQLICHFALNTEEIERHFGVSFFKYFALEVETLAQLEQDGLVYWNDTTLYVTPRGRLLIRHICMLFDAYITTAPTTPKSYSRII